MVMAMHDMAATAAQILAAAVAMVDRTMALADLVLL
jgi:hypothetical protein